MPTDPAAVSANEGLIRLQALRDEHRSLDSRINEFASRPYLSPEDQVEIARLKKLKLRKKDEILAVATEIGVEI